MFGYGALLALLEPRTGLQPTMSSTSQPASKIDGVENDLCKGNKAPLRASACLRQASRRYKPLLATPVGIGVKPVVDLDLLQEIV